MIFEPNAEPGFTNRVLARISKRIATAMTFPPAPGRKSSGHWLSGAHEFFSISPRTPKKPFRLLITAAAKRSGD